jgi:hypothetical protein
VQFYNLLYTGGDESEKVIYLYKMVQSSQTGLISSRQDKLIKAIDYLI